MTRRRHAMTLIEMCVGLGILAVLGALMFQLQRSGWRRIQSTENKLTASRTTHEQAEALRRTLTTAQWAWVVPPAKGDSAHADGTSALLYVGRATRARKGEKTEKRPDRVLEHFHNEEDRRLVVDGHPGRGALVDARFSAPRPHVVGFQLEADEHSPATGMNAARERSTLISAVHLATEHEEDEFAAFAWEEDHPWCTKGHALHYGFVDP